MRMVIQNVGFNERRRDQKRPLGGRGELVRGVGKVSSVELGKWWVSEPPLS